MTKQEQYDEKGNGSHYNSERIPGIVAMERIWGTKAMMIFCEMNEFKYRQRLGKKEDQALQQELKKANWYNEAAKMFQAKIGSDSEVMKMTRYELQNPMMKKNLEKK
jgi:hypothetical protein